MIVLILKLNSKNIFPHQINLEFINLENIKDF